MKSAEFLENFKVFFEISQKFRAKMLKISQKIEVFSRPKRLNSLEKFGEFLKMSVKSYENAKHFEV